jgi:hypothetical protein
MLLLEIFQTDSKVHVLELKEFNKTNSNKGKKKEFSVIIMINQIIGLIATQLNRA